MKTSRLTRFEHATPILRVRSMATSLNYYVEILGFRNAEWGTELFTSVNRDGAAIYLCQGNQGVSWKTWTDTCFASDLNRVLTFHSLKRRSEVVIPPNTRIRREDPCCVSQW